MAQWRFRCDFSIKAEVIVILPPYSWPELVLFPGPGVFLSQHHCQGINYPVCRDTAPVDTSTHMDSQYSCLELGDNIKHCLGGVGTNSELGALARQVGEQVRGGGQTGWSHTGVRRVRQLMEAASGMKAALSVRAGEQTNQQVHAILQPGITDRCETWLHDKR